MSSQRVFYFLPPSGTPLGFRSIVEVFAQAGLELGETAFAIEMDERGIAMKAEEVDISASPVSVLPMPRPGHCVQLTCHDAFLSITLTFGSPHTTQVFSAAVARRSWLELAAEIRSQHESVLIRAASQSKATNILIVDDPPDDFLGNLQPVNSSWLVDVSLPDGTEVDAMVWSKPPLGVVLTSGELCPTGRSLEEFIEYSRHVSLD